MSGFPKNTWQSLMGAALGSFKNLELKKQTNLFYHLAKRYRSSSQVLFSVASSPIDCAEGNAQKVTARFDGSSAETVTEVVEEKSDIFSRQKDKSKWFKGYCSRRG